MLTGWPQRNVAASSNLVPMETVLPDWPKEMLPFLSLVPMEMSLAASGRKLSLVIALLWPKIFIYKKNLFFKEKIREQKSSQYMVLFVLSFHVLNSVPCQGDHIFVLIKIKSMCWVSGNAMGDLYPISRVSNPRAYMHLIDCL